MGIHYREMVPDDIEAVTALITSHVEEDGDLARTYYSEFFKRRANPREKNFVAVNGAERIVGVCGYGPDKYDWEGILWLSWFYVAREYMGTLVAYRLFTAVREHVKALGTRKLYLDTSNYEAYDAARRFYTSAGFRLEGNLVDYYGDGENMIIMGLDLSGRTSR